MNTIPKYCKQCGTTFIVATRKNTCPYCHSKHWEYGFKKESLVTQVSKTVKAMLF